MNSPMNDIIIYYSRDGHTKTVAQALGRICSADLLEIKESKSRTGILGYFRAAFDAMKQNEVKLVDFHPQLSTAKRIYFGCPIWAWKPAPPIMAAINTCDLAGKEVVLFVTMGGTCGNSLQVMQDAVESRGGHVIHRFALITANVKESALINAAVAEAERIGPTRKKS